MEIFEQLIAIVERHTHKEMCASSLPPDNRRSDKNKYAIIAAQRIKRGVPSSTVYI